MNLVLADDVAAVDADCYVMTHTTNPLLKSETIVRAIGEYQGARRDGRADSLFAVSKVQTRFYAADGRPINHDPDNLIRTQDLEPWFEENSNLYIFDRPSFESTAARIGKRPLLFETPPLEAIDIDDQAQWNMAEALAVYERA